MLFMIKLYPKYNSVKYQPIFLFKKRKINVVMTYAKYIKRGSENPSINFSPKNMSYKSSKRKWIRIMIKIFCFFSTAYGILFSDS